ncbi:unnamed protein product [Moneuplotes crassus]|uniref:Uncharacterized protein n=1 Tax=Euplotes crassus TaxID=5936 RepID=A0AAD1XKD3_EUPCR|nr:unnamed protein product [Moneuplotes crassus]
MTCESLIKYMVISQTISQLDSMNINKRKAKTSKGMNKQQCIDILCVLSFVWGCFLHNHA